MTKTLTMIAVLLCLGVGNVSTVAGYEASVPPSRALCSLEIPGYPGFIKGPDFADRLFERGKYVEAAQAYYKVYRCGYMTTIRPEVGDADQLGPFDLALRNATAGKFALAAGELKEILRILLDFLDARILMGEFQWSAGMRSAACATWQEAITAPNFVNPPDSGPNPNTDAIKAKRLLRWAASQMNR